MLTATGPFPVLSLQRGKAWRRKAISSAVQSRSMCCGQANQGWGPSCREDGQTFHSRQIMFVGRALQTGETRSVEDSNTYI